MKIKMYCSLEAQLCRKLSLKIMNLAEQSLSWKFISKDISALLRKRTTCKRWFHQVWNVKSVSVRPIIYTHTVLITHQKLHKAIKHHVVQGRSYSLSCHYGETSTPDHPVYVRMTAKKTISGWIIIQYGQNGQVWTWCHVSSYKAS